MIERLKLPFLNHRARNMGHEILMHHGLVSEGHVAEAASLLVLSHAGLQVDFGSYDTMIRRLAAVRERHGATPEQMQQALWANELSLACED